MRQAMRCLNKSGGVKLLDASRWELSDDLVVHEAHVTLPCRVRHLRLGDEKSDKRVQLSALHIQTT